VSSTVSLLLDLDADTASRLQALAQKVDRDPEALAADAVAAYLELERAEVAAIEDALREADRGELVPHEEVMAEVRQIIARGPR
jgi:predicted transcriptional regulator